MNTKEEELKQVGPVEAEANLLMRNVRIFTLKIDTCTLAFDCICLRKMPDTFDVLIYTIYNRRQILLQLAYSSISDFLVDSIFPFRCTLPELLSWFLGLMKRVDF